MLRLYLALFLILFSGSLFAAELLPPHRPGEVIVKYKADPTSKMGSLKIANTVMSDVEVHGYEIEEYQQHLNIGRLRIPQYKTVEIAVRELNEMEGVEYAEPDYKVYFSEREPTGFEPDSKDLLRNRLLTVPKEYSSSAPKVIVAIIDTGVDYEHEALAPYIWQNNSEVAGNGIDDDRNGYVDDVNGYNFIANTNNAMDDNYHGTHVAGIILNTLVGADAEPSILESLKNSIQIMPLKFLDKDGEGYVSDAIRAISYAVRMGAQVLNNSWGGEGFSRALSEAIILTYNSNRLFIAAAGNEKKNNDQYPIFPASYTHPNIISVAALDGYNGSSLAWFSNFGIQSVDIGAPGVSIRSTIPGGGYAKLSGTSMSAPYVSASAAAIWITNSALNHLQVKNVLLSSSQYIATLSNLILTPGTIDTIRSVEVASQTVGDPNVPPLVLPPPPAESIGYYDGEDLFADSSTGCASAPWLLLPGKGTKPPRPDLFFLLLPIMLLILARFRPLLNLVKIIKKIRNN